MSLGTCAKALSVNRWFGPCRFICLVSSNKAGGNFCGDAYGFTLGSYTSILRAHNSRVDAALVAHYFLNLDPVDLECLECPFWVFLLAVPGSRPLWLDLLVSTVETVVGFVVPRLRGL